MILLLSVVMAIASPSADAFSIKTNPHYPQPLATLRLLTSQKAPSAINHFCVIGYRVTADEHHAWVYWREGKALILWEPSAESSNGPATLAQSRRYLRLDQDVVASEDALEGSTYLVTRAWSDQVLRDCKHKGDRFVVKKPQPNSTRKR